MAKFFSFPCALCRCFGCGCSRSVRWKGHQLALQEERFNTSYLWNSYNYSGECWLALSQPRVFAPAPVVNPWQLPPQPPVPIVWEYDSSPASQPEKKKKQPRAAKNILPVSEWQVKDSGLSFKMSTVSLRGDLSSRRGAAPPPRPRRFRRRTPAPRPCAPFAYMAGMKVEPVNGSYWIYRRRVINGELESISQWRKRIRELVFDMSLSAQAGTYFEEEFYLPLNNSFSALTVEKLKGYGAPLAPLKFYRAPKALRLPVFGPQPNWSYEYINERLAYKARLYEAKENWRQLRKERVKRLRGVVVFNRQTHICASLRSTLISKFEQFAREMINKGQTDFLNSDQDEVIQGEMDDPNKGAHGTNLNPSPDVKSNVALDMQEGVAAMQPYTKPIRNSELKCLSVASSKIDSKTFEDRWFTHVTLKWSTQRKSDSLATIVLPHDLLSDSSFKNSPNYVSFRNHSFWRGNIRVRVLCNANLRQYGQLQVSWYPMAYADEHKSARDNIYSGAQLPHALVNANTSNAAELLIPFEYIYPMLAITRGEQTWDSPPPLVDFANLGQLDIRVLIPLTAASTTPTSCSVSVLFAIEDSEFGGLVDKSLVEYKAPKIEAQMFGAAARFIIQHTADALDDNRDKPTMTAVGSPMIPVNTGSWCHGTGTAEFSNVLRLDPRASTPYVDTRIPDIDEMKIDYVKKIFGIIKILNWKASDKQGTLLWKLDACPILPNGAYDNPEIRPPVAVLADMFAWWRGELVLRIDVVGASEITGRLLVCYVPRVYKDISIKQAVNCSHAIFDLQRENRQFVFKIPYVSDRMFWERPRILREEFINTMPPGTVYIFVYNELIPNATIPDNVNLVFYMAGGDDFEIAVPAFNTRSLKWNIEPIIDDNITETAEALSNYEFNQIDTWRHSGARMGYGVCRYGTTSDHVSQFQITGPWQKTCYRILKPMVKYTYNAFKLTLTCVNADNTGQQTYNYSNSDSPLGMDGKKVRKMDDWGIVICKTQDYFYAIPVPWINDIEWNKKLNEVLTPLQNNHMHLLSFVMPHVEDAFRDYLENTTIATFWEGTTYSTLKSFSWSSSNQSNFTPNKQKFVVLGSSIEGNINDIRLATEVQALSPQQSACAQGIKGGRLVYGESFIDLKDYCRRYQMYAFGTKEIQETTQKQRVIVLKFPAMPHGLDFNPFDENNKAIQYWNRAREGPIPLICSAYRFFCGGIRFRLCINAIRSVDGKLEGDPIAKVCVQHRPDLYPASFTVTDRTDSLIGTDDIELPGYASYHQYDSINNVISFEIPWYLPITKLLLQRCEAEGIGYRWSTLGEVAVVVTLGKGVTHLDYEVYYSFADDARTSVFIGFGATRDHTNIPPTIPVKKEEREREIITKTITVDSGDYDKLVKFAEHKFKDEEITNKCLEDVQILLRKEKVTNVKTLTFNEEDFKSIKELMELGPPPKDFPNLHNDIILIQEILRRAKASPIIDHDFTIIPNMGTSSEDHVIYPNMAISDWMPSAFTKASAAADKISQVDVPKLNETIDETNSFIKTIKDTVRGVVPTYDSLKSKFERYMSTIILCVTNLVHCILNFNIKSIVTAIVSIFTQIKIVSVNVVDKLIDSLFNLFQKENPGASNELKEDAKEVINSTLKDPTAFPEMDDPINIKDMKIEETNHKAAYISTLITGIACVLAVSPKICQSNWDSVFSIIFDNLKNFAMTANHLFTFIKNNLICVQKIGNWLVGDSPQLKDIKFLEEEHKDIHDWALEAIMLTDPWKENQLFTNVKQASRVHLLVAKGNIILLKLSKLKIETYQYSIIVRLLDSLTKLRDRLAKAHLAPPVRWEPFVYELTGPSGTGKSNLLNELPYKLLEKMKIRVGGEVIYHRVLGNTHWNNCRNQPVCSIDEKFPISKPGFDDVQLAELFQLKSRCVFNPPMADLPDKNLRYNPLIVQYASNNAFPNLCGILDETAVYRRRDALIKVQFTPAALAQLPREKVIKNLPYSMRRNYNCLEFYFAIDVMDRDVPANWVGPYNFDDFVKELERRWVDYYIKEERIFRQNMNRALSLIDDECEMSTFDEKWMNEIEGLNPDTTIQKFKEDYNKLYELIKDKNELPSGFSLKIFQTFQNFRKREFKNDEELNANILKYKQALKEASQVRINPKECISPENIKKLENVIEENEKITAKTLNANAPPFVLNPSGGAILKDQSKFNKNKPISNMASCFDIKSLIKSRKYSCVHDIMHHFELNTTSFFKYIKGKTVNFYTFDGESLLESMQEYNRDKDPEECIALSDYCNKEIFSGTEEKLLNSDNITMSSIYFLNRNAYVPDYPCDKDKCILNDEVVMEKFIKDYINRNHAIKPYFQNGNFEQVRDNIPKFYLDNLVKQISGESSSEYVKSNTEKVSFLSDWYNYFKDKLMSIQWKKWFQRIAICLAVFFLVASIWSFWTIGSTTDGACVLAASVGAGAFPEAFASGDNRVGVHRKDTPRQIAQRQLSAAQIKGEMTTQTYTAMRNSIKRNSFFLSLIAHDTTFSLGRCMGICGKTALIPTHYWEAWCKFSKLNSTSNMQFLPLSSVNPTCININFKDLKFQPFENSSLGLLTLPIQIPNFKDIRRLICPQRFHSYTNGLGYIFEGDGSDKNEIVLREISVNYKLEKSIKVQGRDLFSDFSTGTVYKYNNFMGKGKCGSILTATEINTPIIGMHVAGSNVAGYSESIYAEMFAHLDNAQRPSAETSKGEGFDSGWYIDGEVVGIGAVAQKFAHRANEKSRIIPSEIQLAQDPNFPVYTQVAVLSPKDKRIEEHPFSPMIEGCKHHGKPLLPFNSEDLKIAAKDLKNLILAKNKPTKFPGLLTRKEAIAGIELFEGYDHLEWKSSEGFPFVSMRPPGAKDKRWMFSFDEDNKVIDCNRILHQEMDRKWELRNQGIIPETVFTDCLKDCTLPHEKVLEPGKTRIFSISPVDFTIQQRQCTLDFTTSYMKNRLDLEHAVGINPDSIEWTDLTKELLGNDDNIVTGDYSKFGDTIPPEFIHIFYDIIIDWYKQYGKISEEHENQLRIMAYEISNCTHLMFNFLYKTVCGQPSGNSLTVIFNSLANSLYIRLAWLAIMRDTQYNSLVDLHKYVKFFSYGDDIIMSVHKLICELFNAETLHNFFGLHKLKFTNADKSDKIVKYTNLSKADFLKRGFVAHPLRKQGLQIMLAPLKIESIEDTVNWVNRDSFGRDNPNCLTFKDMSYQVCEDALRNAFGRGPEYYEMLHTKLINFWRERNVNFIAADWFQLDHKVFNLNEPLNDWFKFKPRPL